jgi:hypothetical protein
MTGPRPQNSPRAQIDVDGPLDEGPAIGRRLYGGFELVRVALEGGSADKTIGQGELRRLAWSLQTAGARE